MRLVGIGTVNVVTGCGQWVMDLLDYLIIQQPTYLVTVHFGSIILSFCSNFIVLYSLCSMISVLRVTWNLLTHSM